MHATEHEQTIEDIVRIFSALDTADAAEAGGFGSERDAASAELRGLSQEELVGSLEQTGRVLQEVRRLAEQVDNRVAMVVIRDAQNRVEAALELLHTV